MKEIPPLQAQTDPAEIADTILRRLQETEAEWNLAVDYRPTTHRGVLGAPLVLAKRLLAPVVRLYTDRLFKRQAQLNLHFAGLLHNLTQELTRLRLAVDLLQHRERVLAEEAELLRQRLRLLEHQDPALDVAGLPGERSE